MAHDAIRELVERVTYAPGYTKAVGTRVESAEAGYVVMSLARTDDLLAGERLLSWRRHRRAGGPCRRRGGDHGHAARPVRRDRQPAGQFPRPGERHLADRARPRTSGWKHDRRGTCRRGVGGRRGGDAVRHRDSDASRRRLPGPISPADPATMRCRKQQETESRSCCSTTDDLVSRTRMQMKQPRFDSVNARFSVANVFVELLRTKNVYEASVLRFGSGGALGAAR